MLKLFRLLPLATLFKEVIALKKIRYEEIKRGKCPEPQKKRKSETSIEHLILLKKFQKSKKCMYPSKEDK